MKKAYIEPATISIKIETSKIMVTSANMNGDEIKDANQFGSRSGRYSVWGDDEEEY